MTGRSRTYSGWQHEKVAFLFGLSGPRVTSLGAAALLSIAPVMENDWSLGVATIPIAILLVLAAFARMAGLTADEWALTAVKFAHHAARSRTKFASGAFARATRKEESTDLPGIAARSGSSTPPAAPAGRSRWSTTRTTGPTHPSPASRSRASCSPTPNAATAG